MNLPAAGALCYTDILPLGWLPLVAQPDDNDLVHLNQKNRQVLRAINVIEEPSAEQHDDDSPWFHDFQRLDAKLDLALALVGRVVAAQYTLPPIAEISLTADTLAWKADCDNGYRLAKDAFGIASVHLNTCLAYPLQLCGQITELRNTRAASSVSMRLHGMSEQVKTLLEKMIFRCHRRHIAEVRHCKS
ncbi:MAG: PilZ domain-containing protein [Gammaproteobacteria bacterium]|nr:PilZ domain-containing protein [Gammaproteobacteria bacterium]